MSDKLTLGQLRRDLSEYPDDAEVVFGGTILGSELKFYRVKSRGERLSISSSTRNSLMRVRSA